jgi:glycine/D-amino acid oxidase-like deaminating enzyme
MLNPRTHSPDYPKSYYVATASYTDSYPQLDSTLDVDVCVIGGGFSGVNSALELAERGYSVALLESYKIGWGASGRNGGQLLRGIGHGLERFRKDIGQSGIDAIDLMGLEAVTIVRERVQKYGIHCDLKFGFCDLANKPRHLRAFEQEKARLESLNYSYETTLVSRQDMPGFIGADCYLGGFVDQGSGHLHPLNLVTGEASAAKSLGVSIFERSRVTAITQGERCKIHTEKGQVIADNLIICGNAYLAGLNKQLESTVLPAGTYIVVTEPLDNAIHNRLLPKDYAACDQRVDLDYFRLTADKRLLFGGLCTYSGRDPKSIEASLRVRVEAIFPYLKGIKFDYEWGGMMAIGANRLPQIGRLAPNVYYAQAYSGHGVNATHMAARLISESIAGNHERIKLFEKVSHLKFPGGRFLRSPLLAGGMLFHRLRDRF